MNTGEVLSVVLGAVGASVCGVWAYGTKKGYTLSVRWSPKPAPKKTAAKAGETS